MLSYGTYLTTVKGEEVNQASVAHYTRENSPMNPIKTIHLAVIKKRILGSKVCLLALLWLSLLSLSADHGYEERGQGGGRGRGGGKLRATASVQAGGMYPEINGMSRALSE